MDAPVLRRFYGVPARVDVLAVGCLEDVRRALTADAHRRRFNVVSTSATQKAATKYVRGLRPDVVLIDATPSTSEGIELCRHIRRQDSQIVIILLSSEVRESYKVRGLRGGRGRLPDPALRREGASVQDRCKAEARL